MEVRGLKIVGLRGMCARVEGCKKKPVLSATSRVLTYFGFSLQVSAMMALLMRIHVPEKAVWRPLDANLRPNTTLDEG